MENLHSHNEDDLNVPEIELVLKAVGYYQIHIFDLLAKQPQEKGDLEFQSRLASSSIKKIHRLHEKIVKEKDRSKE